MAVCYITQLEIYPSNPQIDTLDISKVDDAINLLDDLNYIRSVIRAILGSDANRWNDVEFLSVKNLTNCCGGVTTTIIGGVSSSTTTTVLLEDYFVQGTVLTKNFAVGEIVFSHVFNRKTYLNDPSFGQVYTEVSPKIAYDEVNDVYNLPNEVQFAIFNKNDNLIGTFTFSEGKNKTKIDRIGPVQEFLPGDVIKIAALSSSLYDLENISFFMKFYTDTYFENSQGKLFDLYTYISPVSSVLEADVDKTVIAGQATFKLFQHQTLNPFFIQQIDPGSVSVVKPIPATAASDFILGIYKTDRVTTKRVGQIKLSPGEKTGRIEMNDPVTNFEDSFVISLRAEKTPATPPGDTTPPAIEFEGLTINFKSIYNLRNKKYEEGYFGFVPGTLPDSKTIFSVVFPKKSFINLADSIFSISDFPLKPADIKVYKNNLDIGSLQFIQQSKIAQNKVPEVQVLNVGDCLYFKTIENTAGTGAPNVTTWLKNLSIILLPTVVDLGLDLDEEDV